MDLRVHRNDEPYWIGKPDITNLGGREEINPYVKAGHIDPGNYFDKKYFYLLMFPFTLYTVIKIIY